MVCTWDFTSEVAGSIPTKRVGERELAISIEPEWDRDGES